MHPTFPQLPGPPPPPDWPASAPQPPGPIGDTPDASDGRALRETKAVAALTLGVLCVLGTVCGMGLSLGIPAIVLGALAHRDIRRSGRTAAGAGLATAGIILGSIGSTVFVGWVGIVAWAMMSPTSSSNAHSLRLPIVSPPVVASSADRRPRGSIVDLHSAAGALRVQLASQASSALHAGEDVVVETSVTSCQPCVEIQQAVTDPVVLTALTKVRLLRVDVTEFRSELAGLRMNEPTVPWFYLLDERGQPMDAISADEWDDNDAENIAPVLGAFVHGKLRPRRTSWRGRTSL